MNNKNLKQLIDSFNKVSEDTFQDISHISSSTAQNLERTWKSLQNKAKAQSKSLHITYPNLYNDVVKFIENISKICKDNDFEHKIYIHKLTEYKKTQSKTQNTKTRKISTNNTNINPKFNTDNLLYLSEVRDISQLANALHKLITTEYKWSEIIVKTELKQDSINDLFFLDISESRHIFSNGNMYYKIESYDMPLNNTLPALFNIKQRYNSDNAKRLIKSHINEFLVSQQLELEIIDNIDIICNIFISAKVLVSLCRYNAAVNTLDLESIFNKNIPNVLKQNAKAIMESKIDELKKRKDSINTKIETIKLENEFEKYMKEKGSEMLNRLESN